jgi:hypothetical protein
LKTSLDKKIAAALAKNNFGSRFLWPIFLQVIAYYLPRRQQRRHVITAFPLK